LAEKSEFDIIFIDGSHRRDDVLIDSILAWQVLKTDGILIWDDYLWKTHLPIPDRPQQAIDVFLGLHGDDCIKRLVGYQIIVQKIDRPSSMVAYTYLSTIQKPPVRTLRNFIKFLRKELIIE
jgi:predicted O-methyltransferase YrrM